jgi:CelD/BcsL family acetyltransferase involved in cellulose biosynthesis
MRRRRLERDLGPLQVVFDDPRQEPFDRCLAWKSAQYLATGYRDLFERHENVQMFVELRRRGALVVTSLWAGELLLAAHLGAFADNRLYWWVPAYDPEFARYSPGRLMLEAMLRESFHRQHVEFDFLIGNEAYKWYYATHFRTIGPLGSPPLGLRIRQQAKRWVGRTVREHRRLAPVANGLKRALRVWRQ